MHNFWNCFEVSSHNYTPNFCVVSLNFAKIANFSHIAWWFFSSTPLIREPDVFSECHSCLQIHDSFIFGRVNTASVFLATACPAIGPRTNCGTAFNAPPVSSPKQNLPEMYENLLGYWLSQPLTFESAYRALPGVLETPRNYFKGLTVLLGGGKGADSSSNGAAVDPVRQPSSTCNAHQESSS